MAQMTLEVKTAYSWRYSSSYWNAPIYFSAEAGNGPPPMEELPPVVDSIQLCSRIEATLPDGKILTGQYDPCGQAILIGTLSDRGYLITGTGQEIAIREKVLGVDYLLR